MDEVHFQQYGSRCRIWVPPEVKDPVLLHHPTRKSVAYFGAVRLRDGKFIFARELNRFDAVSTWNFLRLLRRRSLNSRRRVIVITDNAKYHHAKLHSAWRQEHQAHFRLELRDPSCRPPRPFCSNLSTQYATVRGASPSISATWQQFIPWATSNTPCKR